MFFKRTDDVVSDPISEKLLTIAQYILVVTFGLLPIFFIPGLSVPLLYTKVALVLAATLASLILFSLALLRSGSVRVRFSLPFVALWAFFAATLVSALLSGDFRGSLLGDTLEIHTAGFIGVLCLVVSAWMLIGLKKTMVMRLYMLLAGSTLALVLFHIARLILGASFLGFGIFDASVVLSPIGTWNDLAIFFGLTIILSLIALEQLSLTKGGRALFGIVALASLVMLAVVNFFAVWLILGFVSLVVLVYGLAKDRITSFRKEVAVTRDVSMWSLLIALVTLVSSIVFVVGGPILGSAISTFADISYVEVRPSLEATVSSLKHVYQSEALLGAGPNHFSDVWRLSRQREINDTIFWNTDFSSGIGYVPTFFVTTGIVGGALLSAFFVLFVVSGLRFLLSASGNDRVWYFIGVSAFASGVYIWGITFLYVPGPMLLVLAAMCTGLVYAAHNALAPERVHTYSLGSSPRANLGLVAATVITIGGSVAILYGIGQHYVAAEYYGRGLVAAEVNGDIQKGEELIARAYTLAPNDLFARRVAEYEGARLVNVLSSTGGNQEELQALFQSTFNNGIAAARMALSINDANADNWSVLGSFYAAVVQLNIEGVYDEAKNALTKARELDPQNPTRVLALAQLEILRNNQEGARALALDALRLKPNYSDAIYVLAQLDILAGDIDSAINSARSIVTIEPQNPIRYFQLGVLELSNNNPAGAGAVLEQAVILSPDYANARYFLAFAYDQLGRKSDAEAQLRRVLELNPGNQQVVDLLARLDRGESIIDAITPSGQSSEPINPPVDETASSVPADEPVTGAQVPDSPLLTPVNIGGESDTTSGQ